MVSMQNEKLTTNYEWCNEELDHIVYIKFKFFGNLEDLPADASTGKKTFQEMICIEFLLTIGNTVL